jgi:F0F1-type ATP synthase membrane subunit a
MKMITRLFSIFDPSISTLSLSNISFTLILLLITPLKLIKKNFTNQLNLLIKNLIKNEIRQIINIKKGTGKTIIFLILFILILNIISLLPQTFSNTTQPTITVAIGLIF